MSRPVATACALLMTASVSAGCLSSPHGLGPSGEISDARDGDANPDGMAGLGAWPPAGVSLDVTLGRVLDLDHDGKDDLILASADVAHPGFYILRGTATGVGAAYDAAVPTSVAPVDIDVADISGDGTPDLLAIGRVVPALDPAARLEAFPAIDGLHYAANAWRKDPLDFQIFSPPDDTALIRAVDISGDHLPDIVIANQSHSAGATLVDHSATGFGDMTPFSFTPGAAFGLPSQAFTVPHAPHDQLIIVANFYATTYEAPVAAATVPRQTLHAGWGPTARCDLAGDGFPWVVGGNNTWQAIATVPTDRIYQYDSPLNGPDFYAHGVEVAVACAELDGDVAGRVDLAMLDDRTGVGEPLLVSVLPNLHLTTAPDALTTGAGKALTHDLPGVSAKVLVTGDFDGDGQRELLVVAHDGAITCLRVGADVTPC